MSEFQNPDQQPTPDVKEIEIGEWFLPYGNYATTPYSHARSDYQSKIFNFNVKSLGGFEAAADWDSQNLEEEIDINSPIRVFGPLGVEEVMRKELLNVQKKYETRLLNLSIMAMNQDLEGKTLPHIVECRLPNGVELAANLTPIVNDGNPMTYAWRDSKSDDVFEFVVPEIDTYLEKIQMRIVF